MHANAKPIIFRNAELLREKLTKAESILWEAIRKKRLDGYKFRQQHPISKFILDFYCHQIKLGIEIDGGYHENNGQKFYDEDRTEILNELGVKIIRFSNEDILQDLENVLKIILAEAKKM